MILNIEGNLNRYYAQTLCLIYFPGAKFAEDEVESAEVPVVDFVVVDRDDGIFSHASIRLGDKKCEAECFVPFSEIFPKERVRKMASGHAMTLAAKDFFGYISPWGLLTGVRPAKVAAQYLEDGFGVMKTRKLLAGEYFLNPKKAFLATQVAQAELKLTKNMDKDACSVYISIPFCPTRCAYCSFVSASHKMLEILDDYLNLLVKDIKNVFATIKSLGKTVETVYIGGGTPTTLNARQLKKLLSTVAACTDVTALKEFTLEAGRPDTITAEKMRIAKEYGVTRVSVNPQTLADNVLENIGRRHTADDFFKAYEIAKESGIRDINTDLIVGLPGDDFKKFSSSLERIMALEPSNITVHTFCFKRAAALSKSDKEQFVPDVPTAAKCIQYSQLMLANGEYKPYYMYRQKNAVGNLENVGFAKAGSECMYNIYMMEELHSIFGAGAGAVTKLVEFDEAGERRMKRIFAPKYPYEYIRDFEKIIKGDEETSSYKQKVFEFFGK
ncbi:MAG: coproporphyrinogen dehydrogenase HemZ [Clostridia bacterium]|nr:coproporphyrinogen dehydrogenase HemZ [Clostridia bacterium]